MKLLAFMKKEFHRFFHDPRLILAMILPGVLIFALYSLLGGVISSPEQETYEWRVYLSGQSSTVAAIEEVVKGSGNKVTWMEPESDESAREAVLSGDADAYLIFSEGFDSSFAAESDPAARQSVTIIYDGMSENGPAFYAIADSVLGALGMRYDISVENFLTEEVVAKDVMRSFLPILVVTLIFSACMTVTLESVAGEKERGTLATILVTSVRRRDIALGKILSLSAVSMLGAFSSFLGVFFSMPKLMGISMGAFGGYDAATVLLILVLILSTVPLIVSAMSTVSTYARSVKEASAYVSVLMVLTMLLSVASAFLSDVGNWIVAVPVFNAVVGIGNLLAGTPFLWQSLVGVGVNLLVTAALVFVMTKLLSSERVMFGK